LTVEDSFHGLQLINQRGLARLPTVVVQLLVHIQAAGRFSREE
jgi:hypothetical protein